MNEKPYLTTTEGEPILCQCDHMWHCFNFDPASTNRSIAQRNLSGTCQNTANSKIFDLDSMAESSAICISCEQDDHTQYLEPSIRTIAEVALDMLENKTPNTDVSFAKSFIRDMAHILSQQRAREADCPRHLIDEEYRNKGYKTTNFEQSISFTIVD